MKKLLAFALALILCLGSLASCIVIEKTPASTEAPNTDSSYDLTSAKAYLKNLYKDRAEETGRDFKVVTRLMIGTVVYTVEWTTDTDKVTVEAGENEAIINVNESSEEEVAYTLTATIKAGDGTSVQLSFKHKVPATSGTQFVSEPKAETAYKFGFNQVSLGKLLFVTGEVSGRYLSTTDDVNKAIDVYAEAAEGGFKFYILVGTEKQYITVYNNADGKTSVNYDAAGTTVYTYVAETAAWVTTFEGNTVYLGTYSTFDTVSVSNTSYINAENSGVSQFPAALIVPKAPEVLYAPAVDTPYNFGFKQASVGQYLYVTGAVEGRYLSTTDDLNKAAAVYVEAAEGGFKFYILVGTEKQYITVYLNEENKTAVKYDAAGTSVYTLDSETGAWVTALEGSNYYLGTYASYKTVSVSSTSYINAENSGVSQFPCAFFAYTQPGTVETPDEPTPDAPTALETVAAPEAGKAYKFTVFQKNLGKQLYITGEVSDRYLVTTDDATKAVDVYAEAADGGYKFYVLVNGAKQYIVIFMNENNKHAMKLDAAGTAVFKYDSTTKAWVTNVAGTDYYPGMYNTFDTVSASPTSYITAESSGVTQFPAGLVPADGGNTTPAPSVPEGTVSIADALAAADNTNVVVSGVVIKADAWSTQYNNMSVTISDGVNELYVYRLGTKVCKGDTITVTGTMTTYNNSRQVAQGATAVITTVHNCADYYADASCEAAKNCTSCGKVVGEALGHEAGADGKCIRCGLNLSAPAPVEKALSFGNVANRTSQTTEQQVWEQNGVKLINDKGASTSNVADYSNPARFYKSSKITVECAGMVKIEFNCNTSGHADALKNAIPAADGVNVAVSGNTVTVTFSNPVNSFVIENLSGGQVRLDSMSVYVQQ